jgi:hypothetical protein
MEHSEQEPSFRLAYEWMKDAMDEAGLQGRRPDINPWWCWIRAGDGYVKPTNLNEDENFVLLELSLAPEDVLISDFSMWHVPLNYWLNAEEEEDEAFENELKAAGFNIYMDKPLPEPYHSRVQASWRDVFNLDVVNGFTNELATKAIQGVYWTLRPENIIGIVEPDLYVEPDEQN